MVGFFYFHLMRTNTLLIVLFISLLLQTARSQTTRTDLMFENLGGPTPMSWTIQRFSVVEGLGHGADLSFGLETQSAILGDYGGFYAFGLNSNIRKNVGLFQLNMGGSMATGGGAGAPDGNGFMYRYYGGIGLPLNKKANLGVERHHINFPSGAIASNHTSIRLSYDMPYAYRAKSASDFFTTELSIIGGFWSLKAEDVSVSNENVHSIYTGFRLSQQIHSMLRADLQLGASAIGEVDGFMNYMMGLTLFSEAGTLKPYVRGALGSGGGGGVLSGGGLALEGQLGLEYQRVEISVGNWLAVQTGANSTYVGLSYKLPLVSNFGLINLYRGTLCDGTEAKHLSRIVFSVGTRMQYAKGQDNNGLTYNDMGSAFFGARLPVAKKLWITGETLWAASGGYGAYAEGMFGLEGMIYHQGRLNLRWSSSVVAAGGGGINVGYGTGIAAGLIGSLNIVDGTRASLVMRKKSFGTSAYSPWVFGVQLERDFPIFMP